MAFKPSQTPNNDLDLSEKICELDQANESNETDFSTFDFIPQMIVAVISRLT